MRNGLEKISRFLVCAGGAIIFVCSIGVVADVVLRFFFSVSWLYSFELTTYAFAVAFAAGLSDGVLSRSNVRIDVVYGMLPYRAKGVLDVLTLLVMALLASGVAVYAINGTIGSYEIGARSGTTLQVPLVVPQGLWTLGLVFFAVTTVFVLGYALVLLGRRRWKELSELAGIPAEGTER